MIFFELNISHPLRLRPMQVSSYADLVPRNRTGCNLQIDGLLRIATHRSGRVLDSPDLPEESIKREEAESSRTVPVFWRVARFLMPVFHLFTMPKK